MKTHNFKIEQLPDETIMVCQCGLTYRWYRSAWVLVGFEDIYGKDIDAPYDAEDEEVEQQTHED